MATAYDFNAPNTGTSLATMDAASVRTLWQEGIDVFEQSDDFFSDMCGGPSALIQEKTDTSKGKGQEIVFTVGSGFYGEPKLGEDRFSAEADFEKFQIGSHKLFVDFVRHGERHSERMEEIMGMRGEIASKFNVEQGKWMGRFKTEQLLMMFREQLPSASVVYGGGHAQDTLVAADTLDWDEIISMGVQAKRLGGLPAHVGEMQNGQPVFANTLIATTDALYSLDVDPNYKQVLRETVVQDRAARLFKGGYAGPKGHVIAEYTPIDHDGIGPIGSPLNPKALLGTAITAGTAAFDIIGGGASNPANVYSTVLFFKYFGGHAYRFVGADDPTANGVTTLTQTASLLANAGEPLDGPHYLLIINPPNAAVSPNKVGMYKYTTGNNGNKITITQRLSQAIGGLAHTTVGSVVYNSGVWTAGSAGFAGHVADAGDTLGVTVHHPVGSLILPCNAKGQIYADSLMLGRRAAYRGWGKYRNKRYMQEHEGGFVTDTFVGSVFGQALRKDRTPGVGRVPGVIRLRHAIQYAGVPLPTVV